MKRVSRRHILEAGAATAVVGGAAALQLTDQGVSAKHGKAGATGPGVQQGFFALEGYATFPGEQMGHEISFPHNYGQSSPVVTQQPFFNANITGYAIARPNPFGALVTVTARDVGEFYCMFIWTATPQ